jgi:UDP-N-acetylmuramyl tripeptide synthase
VLAHRGDGSMREAVTADVRSSRPLPRVQRPGSREQSKRPQIGISLRHAEHPRPLADAPRRRGRISRRDSAAVLAGRVAAVASRLTGRNGAAIPGLVAERISPGIAARLAADMAAICLVSGTNGKTSTAHYLAGILEAGGRAVISNRSGANLAQAIAATLIAESSITAGIAHPARSAVLEVDEAVLPAMAAALPISAVVITNIFRDQLDRFGETDHILRIWSGMIGRLSPETVVVWCADDPRQRALVGDRARAISFGLERPVGTAGPNVALDASTCPGCGRALTFAWSAVGHLGAYSCDACGFARPIPWLTVESSDRTLGGQTLLFRWSRSIEGSFEPGEAIVRVRLPSLANAYNAAAAVAGAAAVGVDPATAVDALASLAVPFGRFEQVEIDGRRVILMLVKNPASFGEVARLISESPLEEVDSLLFVLSDDHPDGRDVSWYWDVDPKPMFRGRPFAIAGSAGPDFEVRCKYALALGSEASMEGYIGRARVPADGLARAVAATPVGGTCVVVSTYTALMELRADLAGRAITTAMPR